MLSKFRCAGWFLILLSSSIPSNASISSSFFCFWHETEWNRCLDFLHWWLIQGCYCRSTLQCSKQIELWCTWRWPNLGSCLRTHVPYMVPICQAREIMTDEHPLFPIPTAFVDNWEILHTHHNGLIEAQQRSAQFCQIWKWRWTYKRAGLGPQTASFSRNCMLTTSQNR